MRALLIVNPYATSTTPAGRDTLANTLAARMDLTVEQTTHRGHAQELAQIAASRDRYEAIVVHGGDGSVNEVVNGLLGAPGTISPEMRPRLGIIPGGSANVFARAAGIHSDPLLAASQLITLLESGIQRSVNLGTVDDRWFLFNCGMGIDAHVVKAMEIKRKSGKTATPSRYLFTTVVTFMRHRNDEKKFVVSVVDCDGKCYNLTDTAFIFILNTTPWTYLSHKSIETNPGTTLSDGLGVFASSTMSVARNLPLATRLIMGVDPHARHIFRRDNVLSVSLHSPQPLPAQIDGDYIGERTTMRLGYRSDALAILAPDNRSVIDDYSMR